MGASASTASFFSSFGFFVAATASAALMCSPSLRNLTISTASRVPTTTFQSGSLSWISPFMTATLPGMTSVRLLIFLSSSNSSKNFLMELEENLPAAHAVKTDMPEASVMSRLTGTLERSISPETRK